MLYFLKFTEKKLSEVKEYNQENKKQCLFWKL